MLLIQVGTTPERPARPKSQRQIPGLIFAQTTIYRRLTFPRAQAKSVATGLAALAQELLFNGDGLPIVVDRAGTDSQ